MFGPRNLPLVLGLVLFSFLVSSVLIIPFINILYKLKLTRKKEAPSRGKIPLFDKLHDKKAGTPVGGGILLVPLISVFFVAMFPLANHMGVKITSSYDLSYEIALIVFTFVFFGILGLMDDYLKMFGKPKVGALGMWFGLGRKTKFFFQIALAVFIGYIMYSKMGIDFLHIPLVGKTFNLGFWYVPFAAFVIVSFVNAFNVTDGLDGLSSGLLIICLVAFGAISANILDTPISLFISLSVGVLIAFLYFNIWPARIMLGDTGSLAFGSILALVGLLTGSIIALVVIGGVFVIEIASSAIQILGWKILKRPIFPLAPLHHAFLVVGWEEPKIVVRAWLAGIVLAIFGLWLATI